MDLCLEPVDVWVADAVDHPDRGRIIHTRRRYQARVAEGVEEGGASTALIY